MMQHEQCSQLGCMASFVQNSLGLEPPKFPIGSRVLSRWVDEFDQAHEDAGIVIGIFPAERDWLEGWWYVLRLDKVQGCDWLTLPCDDIRHESDIQSPDTDCG